MVLAPLVRGRKGEYGKVLEELRSEGFSRAKIDGELRMLEDEIVLDKKYKHDISIVVDRLVMRGDLRKRLADSIETAVALADGMIEIETVPSSPTDLPDATHGTVTLYSEKFACPDHGPVIPELEPRIFSFNSPHGACPRCTGLGSQMEIDPELVVPDPSLSIGEGALAPWAGSTSQYYEQITQAIAEKYDIDLEAPWESLDEDVRDLFLEGTNGDRIEVSYRNRYGRKRSYATRFEGILPNLERRYQRDRLRPRAREDRGVHVAAAVPGVQGRAAEARVARGAGRRRRHPRAHLAERQARAAVAGRRAALGDRAPHRAADRARDRRAPALPGQRRHRLPVDGSRGGDAVGRRGAAHPAGHADRLGARRRPLRARRAVDRPAPARQLQAHRDPRAPARAGQHGPRRRARRADDARGRPPRRPRPGRRRARRADHRRGHRGAGREGQGVAHGPVPGRHAHDPRAREAAHAGRLPGDPRAPSSTTSSRSTSTSRWAC